MDINFENFIKSFENNFTKKEYNDIISKVEKIIDENELNIITNTINNSCFINFKTLQDNDIEIPENGFPLLKSYNSLNSENFLISIRFNIDLIKKNVIAALYGDDHKNKIFKEILNGYNQNITKRLEIAEERKKISTIMINTASNHITEEVINIASKIPGAIKTKHDVIWNAYNKNACNWIKNSKIALAITSIEIFNNGI